MKRNQIAINRFTSILFLTFLVTSCLTKIPEAKWVYGSWIEALSGDKIEFFKDGKVEWFGKIGSFKFIKNSKILCIHKCPDGELKIKIGSKIFRTSYNVKKKEENWEENAYI